MIKNILFIGLTIFSFSISSQDFAVTYSFAAVTSTSGPTDPTPPPTFPGLTFGSFSAVGTSTNPNAGGRFSFTKWPGGATDGTDAQLTFTGAPSPTVYYQVSIIPSPTYTLDLNVFYFGMRRSGTGVRNYAIRSSRDNYTSNLAATTGTSTKLSVIPTDIFFWNYDSVATTADQKGSKIIFDSTYKAITDTISFRFYAWNSEAGGGTFSIDNVSFFGSATNTVTPPDSPGIGEYGKNNFNGKTILMSAFIRTLPAREQWSLNQIADLIKSKFSQGTENYFIVKMIFSRGHAANWILNSFLPASTPSGFIQKPGPPHGNSSLGNDLPSLQDSAP
jgi:hypothetical protein